jgi:hypothetical protein
MIRKVLGLCLTTLWSTSVFGQFLSPVTLNPNPALSTDQVFVEFTTGPCTGVLGGANNPAVTVLDDSIDILIEGVWDDNIQFCNRPIIDRSISVGSFPGGDYTVIVRFRYEPLFRPPQIELLGELDLSVQEVPMHAVPNLNALGISTMFFLFLLFGILICARFRF